MIRNQAGQVVTANLVSRDSGLPVDSGVVTVQVLGDGGTKTDGAGTIENEGGGTWAYFPTKAETNFAAVTFSFAHDDAVRVDVQVAPLLTALAGGSPADCGGEDSSSAAIANQLPCMLAGPKSASVDGVSVTQYSPAEIIEATRFVAANNAAKKGHRGLRFTKLVPPGA